MQNHEFYLTLLYMIFVYFDALKPNPGFILPVHPSKYEKLVKNCENTKNITKNHENSH